MPRKASGGAKRRVPRGSQSGSGAGITTEALNEVVANFVQALGENGSCDETLLCDMGRLFFSSMLDFTRILQKHANTNTPIQDTANSPGEVHANTTTVEHKKNTSRDSGKLVKRNVAAANQPKTVTSTRNDADGLKNGDTTGAKQPKARGRGRKRTATTTVADNVALTPSVASSAKKLQSQETFNNAPTPRPNLNLVQGSQSACVTPCRKALALGPARAQHKLNLDIFNFVDQCTNSGASHLAATGFAAASKALDTGFENEALVKGDVDSTPSNKASSSSASGSYSTAEHVPEMIKTTTQLDSGPDVDFGFWSNNNCAIDFLRAAFAGDFGALSSCNVDVNYTDVIGRTALHYACAAGSADCVSYLVSMGIDVNLADKKGWTALHIATSKAVPLVAKILIDAGANIDVLLKHRCAPSRLVDVYSPCIHFAAIKGSREITTWLLGVGANINHRDSAGMTPLHYAAFRDNTEYIHFLIANGANLNVKDVNGRGPFHSVALCGSVAVAKALVEYTPFTNDMDNWALTPIKLSQIRGHSELEEFFKNCLGIAASEPEADANGLEAGEGGSNGRGIDGDVNDLSMVLSSTIAVALQEPNIDQIYRCVVRIGPDICKTIFDLTMQIQRNGGVRTCDNKRRRSSGGIFFTFVKELYLNDIISRDDYNYIRAAENEKRSARANERRMALRSKLPHGLKTL